MWWGEPPGDENLEFIRSVCRPTEQDLGDASLIPFLDPVFEKLQEWTAEGLQYLGIGEENSYKLAAGAFLIVSLKGGGKSNPSTNRVKKGSQHGNSLSSTRPT